MVSIVNANIRFRTISLYSACLKGGSMEIVFFEFLKVAYYQKVFSWLNSKVQTSRKQIMVSLILPKNERNALRIVS